MACLSVKLRGRSPAQIGCEALDILAMTARLYLEHPAEFALCAFGPSTTQVGLIPLCAHDFPRTCFSKPFCRTLMRFQFVFFSFLSWAHVTLFHRL